MDIDLTDDDDLLREHVHGVRRLARHLVRDPDDAEDIAQESLLAALGRGGRGVRDLGAWLRGIVRHKALDHRRAGARRRRHEAQGAPARPGPGTDDVIGHLEIQGHLVSALKALPEPYRLTLWRRYFEGASARVIAADAGLPVETVRTRIKRGLAKMRAEMDHRSGGRRAVWTAALVPVLPMGGPAIALAVKGALAVMTTKAFVAGTAAIAVVTTLAIFLGTRNSDHPREPEAGGEATRLASHAVPMDPAPPRLVGHELEPSGQAAVPDETADPSAPRLRGCVFTGDRLPIPGAVISVVEGPGFGAPTDRPWRVLGRARSDEHGRYEVELDESCWPAGASPNPVLAVAEADGFVRARQPVTWQERVTVLDLVLEEGLALEGYIRDASGRPIADLPVRVATLSSPPHMVYGTLYWSERKRLSTEDGDYFEGRARTDERGHFRVRGLGVGRYGAFSDDLRWFLEQEHLAEIDRSSDAPSLELVAVPARAVMGTVKDAATGEPLVKGHVEFMLRAPGGDSMGSYCGARDGRFLVGWSLDDELSGRVDVTASGSARGYKEARAEGVLLPESPILTLDLALPPILERDGHVVLSVTDPSGAPLPGLLYLWANRQDDDTVRLRRRPRAAGRGVFHFDLPAGTYDVVIWPRHVLGDRGAGRFEVTVLPGEEVQATTVAGGGATVRLRLPLVTGSPPPSHLSIKPVGERSHKLAGASTDLSQQEEQILAGEDLVWTGFLPGTWLFELQWGEERIERTVRLAKGDDRLVDFR